MAFPDEGARQTITQFDDGRTQTIGRADPTLTNTETRRSIVHHSSYLAVETIDEETGDILVEIHGRIFIGLTAGDQGPFGTVGPDGALLSVTGNQTFTVDAESGRTTTYTLDGRVRDLCAALEG